jgi:hypothetical protein
VGFVVDKVTLGQVSLRVLRFSPANIIPPLLHIHLSPPHEMCDSSDEAAHYQHLGPKFGASFLTRHFGWNQKQKVKSMFSFLPFPNSISFTHKFNSCPYGPAMLSLIVILVTIIYTQVARKGVM